MAYWLIVLDVSEVSFLFFSFFLNLFFLFFLFIFFLDKINSFASCLISEICFVLRILLKMFVIAENSIYFMGLPLFRVRVWPFMLLNLGITSVSGLAPKLQIRVLIPI